MSKWGRFLELVSVVIFDIFMVAVTYLGVTMELPTPEVSNPVVQGMAILVMDIIAVGMTYLVVESNVKD